MYFKTKQKGGPLSLTISNKVKLTKEQWVQVTDQQIIDLLIDKYGDKIDYKEVVTDLKIEQKKNDTGTLTKNDVTGIRDDTRQREFITSKGPIKNLKLEEV